MHLVEVDPISAKAAQALVDGLHDPAARVAPLVLVGAHLIVELGCQHDVVAPSLQCRADDLFAFTERVDVGGVDEVDAAVERALDDAFTRTMVGVAPRSEHHGSEAEATDVDARPAQYAVFHRRYPFSMNRTSGSLRDVRDW